MFCENYESEEFDELVMALAKKLIPVLAMINH